MATVDLKKSPDYDALVEAILEKTKAGKLDWQTTANERSYISAVKGERTFEVVKSNPEVAAFLVEVKDGVRIPPRLGCWVKVMGPDGELLVQTPMLELADELYEVARRLALRVDENIDSTVQLLETL